MESAVPSGALDQAPRRREALDLIGSELARASRPCVTTSFQAGGVVLTHMIRQVAPDIPVLFLDTFHHFRDTYTYGAEIAAAWGLNLVTLAAVEPAPGLWRTDSAACCARHKVRPLFDALRRYDLWFAALRREQSASRATLAEVDDFPLPGGGSIRKVSPLAAWSADDVRAYAASFDIPLLPLYDAGYTSIGCEPCTTPPTDPADSRSGRWAGQKLECGIHIAARGC